jgi:hypothetical protein
MGTASNATATVNSVLPLTPLQQAVTQLEGQAKADLLVPANTALNSLIATPDTQNAMLQWPAFAAAATALLPLLEGQGIADLATAIKAWLNTGSILAAAPPAPAPVSAAPAA